VSFLNQVKDRRDQKDSDACGGEHSGDDHRAQMRRPAAPDPEAITTARSLRYQTKSSEIGRSLRLASGSGAAGRAFWARWSSPECSPATGIAIFLIPAIFYLVRNSR